MNSTPNNCRSATNEDSSVPQPLLIDYLQIGVLGLMVLIGVPINVGNLWKMAYQMSRQRNPGRHGYSRDTEHTLISDFRSVDDLRSSTSAPVKKVSKPVVQPHSAFVLLKTHLLLANLLILLGYCVPLIGWLITYRWIAGKSNHLQ